MLGLPENIEGLLFDMDGVLTQTAKVHAEAWKQTFDAFLRRRADQDGTDFVPFDKVSDYDDYVDGLPREDGVRSFLKSRGIELPEGSDDDPPDADTIHGIGNDKNQRVLKLIREEGVEAYEGSVRYVQAAQRAGLRRAVVSSSTNTHDVLAAAKLTGMFDAVIDGVVAQREHLHGKPAPDTFLAGAKALGVEPDPSGGLRGCPGRCGGRTRRQIRLCGRRRSSGPARRAEGTRRRRRGQRPGGAARVVIQHSAFEVDPWAIRESELDLERLAQTESVFALSNGHVGLRGNLDEGEPSGLPGSYLGGFWEARALPYAEPGYGDPEQGQAVVNVTNGKIIRLLVGDSPFDVRYGTLHSHTRELDFRDGVLKRSAEWTSPSHQSVRVRSTRLVSLSQRAIAAISYEVEPVDEAVRIVLQSELITNEELPSSGADPRAGSAPTAPLESELYDSSDMRSVLIHRTAGSGLRAAVAMRHELHGPEKLESSSEAFPDHARMLVATTLEPGQTLRVVKYLAYGWSRVRSTPALLDQVSAALSEAHVTGWEGLCKEQRAYLDAFWGRGGRGDRG